MCCSRLATAALPDHGPAPSPVSGITTAGRGRKPTVTNPRTIKGPALTILCVWCSPRGLEEAKPVPGSPTDRSQDTGPGPRSPTARHPRPHNHEIPETRDTCSPLLIPTCFELWRLTFILCFSFSFSYRACEAHPKTPIKRGNYWLTNPRLFLGMSAPTHDPPLGTSQDEHNIFCIAQAWFSLSNPKSLTHHCILYQLVGWSSLSRHRQQHWYIFIYKAILGKLPLYLCRFLNVNSMYPSTALQVSVYPYGWHRTRKNCIFLLCKFKHMLQTPKNSQCQFSLY